ncbi:kinesin-like nuclear fusion protein [Agyrium rufum]|nr:kinesin-like nuclear fusion protein [Agyrium rufum]
MERKENSFIPQPRSIISKLPSPAKLSEITNSAANVRPSNLPPPGSIGMKRKAPTEHALAGSRPAPVQGMIRPSGPTRGVSLTSLASSTSTSTRPQSGSSYRYASNSSMNSSVGSFSRPPSAQSSRPQTSMSGRAIPRGASGISRPGSSVDNHGWADRDQQQQMDISAKSNYPFSSAQQHASIRRIRNLTPTRVKDDQHNMSTVSQQHAPDLHRKIPRNISLSIAISQLTISPSVPLKPSSKERQKETSPSRLPTRIKDHSSFAEREEIPSTPSPSKTHRTFYLTKDSNCKSQPVTDIEARVNNTQSEWLSKFKEIENDFDKTRKGMKEKITDQKAQIAEVEAARAQLAASNVVLQQEIDLLRANISSTNNTLDNNRRQHAYEIDDLERERRRDVDTVRREAEEDRYRATRKHEEELDTLKRKLEDALEEEQRRRNKEVQALSSEGALERQKIEVELDQREQKIRILQYDMDEAKRNLDRERGVNKDLQIKNSDAAASILLLEAALRSSRAHVDFLESDSKSQSHAFADLEQKTQDAIKIANEAREKLRIEETLRRKLHNQVQELKGNIRVFCRVRPSLPNEQANGAARISYPDDQTDSKEVQVLGQEKKSSIGTDMTEKHGFSFDRVFSPNSQNAEIFDEISQLVQSALDGYNVCIFCYGQTGCGKTYTMSSSDGMIPRAVQQIYDTAKDLEEKGWTYSMEGSFVEIYNENINDLLGKPDELDKKKHEIKHDMAKCKTIITDVNTVTLDSPEQVHTILHQASNNRSVAATKANERSSRSHSVFILKLIGENSITGERSEGTLNLVDLAGSERLSHSDAKGERLKETQNINKSLSSLGDVISALGQAGNSNGHIPYRNSKLTYLLQFSLGGNSKTLMFVMISPLQAHLNETLTSLKFATKVHNTHIGTAKKQTRIKE